MKPIIIELVKNLYSLYEDIIKNMKSLEKKEFSWGHESSNISTLKEIDTGFLSFYKSYLPPDDTISLIESKPYLNGLRKKLKELAGSIYSEEFRKECEKRIEEFLEEHENTPLEDKDLSRISSTLLAYTINNYDSLPYRNTYYEFWKENKEHFLKFRERDEVKEKIEKVEQKVKTLHDSHAELTNQLDKILSYYQRKFDIPLKEFVRENK